MPDQKPATTAKRITLLALAAIWLAACINTLSPAQNSKPAPDTAPARQRPIQNPESKIQNPPASASAPTPAPAASLATPPPPTNTDCLACHADAGLTRETNGKTEPLAPFPADAFAKSSHAKLACVDCHIDAKDPAHEPLALADCTHCHLKQTEAHDHSVHGKNGALAKTGVAETTSGNIKRPAECQDCHGSHDIQPTTVSTSPLYFLNQTQSCGKCHTQEVTDIKTSVHGQAIAQGKREAPACTDCHDEGGHSLQPLRKANSLRIALTCSRCHAPAYLAREYNMPATSVKTYMQSYHGLAAQGGSAVVANCASCHGYHKILPSTDPASNINPANLVATCGKCHIGASEKFVSGKIHAGLATGASHGYSATINDWVRRIYLVLIFITVGGMLLHNILLFRKKLTQRLTPGHAQRPAAPAAAPRPPARVSRLKFWQHAFLAGSFIILALTGFALKYPDSWIAGLFGTEYIRRLLHRVAAVVMMIVFAYHVIYIVATKEGRRLFKDYLPRKKDLTDMLAAARALLTKRPMPDTGHAGYAEKMEYWAVIWGTVIMGITGFMLWFLVAVTQYIPRWIIDVGLTIHFYEAVLACLAIVVWHFYHVIFDPDVYPLKTYWEKREAEEEEQQSGKKK